MPFQLINTNHHMILEDLVSEVPNLGNQAISTQLTDLITRVHQDIPEKRRISTGRYSIVKALGSQLTSLLIEAGLSPFVIGSGVLETPDADGFVRAVGLKVLVEQCLEAGDLPQIRACFESAAGDEDWITRECASGLVRPLIKAFPEEVRSWYLELVKSPDPNQRRFVSESLRPVVENRWFHKQPDYALGVIQHLFQEKETYPRTSVGNNLSDWMRLNEEYTWPIVSDLAQNGDPNSYWIAYRACRSYVKKEPVKVMQTLGISEYKYKKRHYNLVDYR